MWARGVGEHRFRPPKALPAQALQGQHLGRQEARLGEGGDLNEVPVQGNASHRLLLFARCGQWRTESVWKKEI
jgi:hypothetical protein